MVKQIAYIYIYIEHYVYNNEEHYIYMRCVLYVEHIKLHVIMEKYMVKQTSYIYVFYVKHYIYIYIYIYIYCMYNI